MSPEIFQVELPSPTIERYRDAVYAVSSLCVLIAGAGVVIVKTLITKRTSAPVLDGDGRHEDLPSSDHS